MGLYKKESEQGGVIIQKIVAYESAMLMHQVCS